jgi:hypothetical protein
VIDMELALDSANDVLVAARVARQRGDWSASYAAFVRADAVGPMGQDDLNAFATSAWRLGHANEAVRLSERVYDRLVRTDPVTASMAALEVALQWITRGDVFIGRGWMDRARRLLAGTPVGSTNGYLAYLDAVVAVRDRDLDDLATKAAVARDVCAPLEDPSLGPLSAVVQALDAFYGGRVGEGHGFVDRALPSVESGAVRLEWAGDVYVLLLHASRALTNPSKTREWTESMARWCRAHDAPVYHRVLHLYRAESEQELLDGSSTLDGVHCLAAGEGFRRLAEMRRRRGDVEGAAAALARARRLGVG